MTIKTIQSNLKSGLTVALISLPLSVSLAVASGATPQIGIITAFWAGLIAALFAGSAFNIIGPTGALSGIVATYVLLHGIGTLPVLTILSAVIILLAYTLRLERYLILIPSSVIHGFTLGVACIIALGQLNYALGLHGLPQHESFFANTVESLRHLPAASLTAVVIFLCFTAGLFVCKKFIPRLPGAIILAPIGIMLGYLAHIHAIPLVLQTLGDKFGDISFKFFMPVHWEFSISMIKAGAVVALVAILETMLSAKIADGMTRTKHNERRELLALGLANLASGLVGGMPATAALARTSLNIKTGANHQASATINALAVGLISLFFLRYFSYIPLPVIAAILVFVAIQMVETKHFIKFWRYERVGFFIALLVAAVTVMADPILGILLGVAVSLLFLVDRLSRGQFELKVNKFEQGVVASMSGETIKEIEENADVLLYSIRGKLCYINSRAHIARFEANLIKYKNIILRLREVCFMDIDGVEALDEIVDIIESRGQQALLTSIDPGVLRLLEQSSATYNKLKQKKLVFEKTEYALRFLGIPTHTE